MFGVNSGLRKRPRILSLSFLQPDSWESAPDSLPGGSADFKRSKFIKWRGSVGGWRVRGAAGFQKKTPFIRHPSRDFGYMQCMMAQLTRKNVKGLQVKRLSWASGDLSTSATTRGIQICHEDVDLWSQRGSGLIMFSPKPMDFRPLSLVELGLIQVELTVSIPKRPLWIGSVGNQWE